MKFIDNFLDKMVDRLVDEYDVNPNGVKNGAVGIAAVATPVLSYAFNWAILTDLDQTKIDAASVAIQTTMNDMALAPAGVAAYFVAKAITSKDGVSMRRTLLAGFAAAALGTVATAPLTHSHYEKVEEYSIGRGQDQNAPQ